LLYAPTFVGIFVAILTKNDLLEDKLGKSFFMCFEVSILCF